MLIVLIVCGCDLWASEKLLKKVINFVVFVIFLVNLNFVMRLIRDNVLDIFASEVISNNWVFKVLMIGLVFFLTLVVLFIS